MTSPQVPMAAAPALPAERVGRGTLLALLVLPLGVTAAVLANGFGYFRVLVALAAVAAAAALYRRGSGGRVGVAGALVVGGIGLATVVLGSLISTADLAYRIYGRQHGLSTLEALSDPGFGAVFVAALGRPEALLMLVIGIGALLFTAGGMLRQARRDET